MSRLLHFQNNSQQLLGGLMMALRTLNLDDLGPSNTICPRTPQNRTATLLYELLIHLLHTGVAPALNTLKRTTFFSLTHGTFTENYHFMPSGVCTVLMTTSSWTSYTVMEHRFLPQGLERTVRQIPESIWWSIIFWSRLLNLHFACSCTVNYTTAFAKTTSFIAPPEQGCCQRWARPFRI